MSYGELLRNKNAKIEQLERQLSGGKDWSPLLQQRDTEIERLKQIVTRLSKALSAANNFIHEYCYDSRPE